MQTREHDEPDDDVEQRGEGGGVNDGGGGGEGVPQACLPQGDLVRFVHTQIVSFDICHEHHTTDKYKVMKIKVGQTTNDICTCLRAKPKATKTLRGEGEEAKTTQIFQCKKCQGL